MIKINFNKDHDHSKHINIEFYGIIRFIIVLLSAFLFMCASANLVSMISRFMWNLPTQRLAFEMIFVEFAIGIFGFVLNEILKKDKL